LIVLANMGFSILAVGVFDSMYPLVLKTGTDRKSGVVRRGGSLCGYMIADTISI
jgi:hypothetical protein